MTLYRQLRTSETNESMFNRFIHRVYRVLGFFSCRPNWDPPPSLNRRRVCPLRVPPLAFGSGRGTTEYIFLCNRVTVSAHLAGASTATLLVMVSLMKGGGRAPPRPFGYSSGYYSVYSLRGTPKDRHTQRVTE
jgi:hypothetical protein